MISKSDDEEKEDRVAHGSPGQGTARARVLASSGAEPKSHQQDIEQSWEFGQSTMWADVEKFVRTRRDVRDARSSQLVCV